MRMELNNELQSMCLIKINASLDSTLSYVDEFVSSKVLENSICPDCTRITQELLLNNTSCKPHEFTKLMDFTGSSLRLIGDKLRNFFRAILTVFTLAKDRLPILSHKGNVIECLSSVSFEFLERRRLGLEFCVIHKTNISTKTIIKALKTFLKGYMNDVNQRHQKAVQENNVLKKERRQVQLCRKTVILSGNCWLVLNTYF